jgi:hypothetical protein
VDEQETSVKARIKTPFFPSVALILVSLAGCNTATSNSTGSNTGTSTIGSLSFSNVQLELLSYGQSNDTFAFSRSKATTKALTTTSGGGTSYCALFEFYLGTRSSTILGFNVYRSTDGSNFTEIGTENYGTLTSTGSLGSAFYYYDYDATLALGTTYYYKAQAFDSSGNLSSMAPVAGATFMNPFTVSLTSPLNNATTITGTSKSFSFTLSDSTLWSSSLSDYFYFSLYIKNKTGEPCYYGEFRYNFSTSSWQAPGSYSASTGVSSWTKATTVSGISYSSGVISVDLLNSTVSNNNDSYVVSTYGSLDLLSGATYEWDIYGDWWGTSYGNLGTSSAMDPAFFVKTTTSSSGTGYGVSYANTYANGEGSLNGAFSFSY